MYDSYIRAFRWASDRIGDQGVIAFVSNGGWIDGNTADGMRKTLADEFSTIYIYNLRGNGRVAGDAGQREGRPVFEFGGWKSDGTEIKDAKGGSRTTIAITVLVKNPARTGTPVEIKYAQVADYLSAGQKINAVSDAASFNGLPLTAITPTMQATGSTSATLPSTRSPRSRESQAATSRRTPVASKPLATRGCTTPAATRWSRICDG